MRRFSYIFSTPDDDPHSVDVNSGIVAVLGTKLIKPSSVGAIYVKGGPITPTRLLGDELSLPQFLHLLDTENPWRSKAPKSVASGWWQRQVVYVISVFGLTEKTALKVHDSLSQDDRYRCCIPQTDHPVSKHLLEDDLVPLVAFNSYECATSGAVALEILAGLKLNPVYKNPEVFMLQDACRAWAGLPPQGGKDWLSGAGT